MTNTIPTLVGINTQFSYIQHFLGVLFHALQLNGKVNLSWYANWFTYTEDRKLLNQLAFQKKIHLIWTNLEPKWPLFSSEKALFSGVNLQNRGHWGSRNNHKFLQNMFVLPNWESQTSKRRVHLPSLLWVLVDLKVFSLGKVQRAVWKHNQTHRKYPLGTVILAEKSIFLGKKRPKMRPCLSISSFPKIQLFVHSKWPKILPL